MNYAKEHEYSEELSHIVDMQGNVYLDKIQETLNRIFLKINQFFNILMKYDNFPCREEHDAMN